MAGPVVAACVILAAPHKIVGLADSKQLSEKNRDELAVMIRQQANAWAVAFASVVEIDRLNILQATLLAMERAVKQLSISPDIVMVDGNHGPKLEIPVYTLVKGDNLLPQISAASILAKTARDAEMKRLHEYYPQYGFDRHKGYPTKQHVAALREFGVTAIHRQSFAPVRQLLTNKTQNVS